MLPPSAQHIEYCNISKSKDKKKSIKKFWSEHHQQIASLVLCAAAFLKFSSIYIHNFWSYFANRQNARHHKYNLLGGGHKVLSQVAALLSGPWAPQVYQNSQWRLDVQACWGGGGGKPWKNKPLSNAWSPNDSCIWLWSLWSQRLGQ